MLLEEVFTRQAAGCLIMARSTKRFLLGHRSEDSSRPGTWALLGGKAHPGEAPRVTARREVKEESGITLTGDLTPLYVFLRTGFAYHNYLTMIDDEITPPMEAEHQGFRWCEFGDWPRPLHPGLRALLRDSHSMQIVQANLSS